MSSDDYLADQDKDKPYVDKQDVYAKRSTMRVLVIGQIVTAVAVVVLAGMYITTIDMDAEQAASQKQIYDAIARLELKALQDQLLASDEQQQASGNMPAPIRISADDDPIIGSPDAPISIIEFSDFQCPFCARFHVQTLPLIIEEYIEQGKAKLVFRDFPIQSIHPNAMISSLAAECANEQGQFKPMHDILFDNQRTWSSMKTNDAALLFVQYATELLPDIDAFESCLWNGKYVDEIINDLEDGRQYGVGGTPGFFIGNDELGYIKIEGAQPIDSFRKIIDAQLGSG